MIGAKLYWILIRLCPLVFIFLGASGYGSRVMLMATGLCFLALGFERSIMKHLFSIKMTELEAKEFPGKKVQNGTIAIGLLMLAAFFAFAVISAGHS